MPSIFPFTCRASGSEAAKTSNFRLEESALTTRNVYMASTGLNWCRTPARFGKEHADGAGGEARPHVVGARCQDNRHPRAQYEARRIRPRQESQVLRQHVAGFEIGDDEDLRPAGDFGPDALDACRFRVDRIVEGERSVEDAAGYLPAFGHLAECGRIDGRGDLRRHRL